jgi:excisionase family DNA binding protein
MVRLHTMADVTKGYGVCRKSIMRAINNGDLNAIMVGNRYRFTDEQLEGFLAKRTLSKAKHVKRMIV